MAKKEAGKAPAQELAPLQKNGSTALDKYGLSAEDKALMYGDLGADDISIPRLVILQATSPEVSDGQGAPGDFYVKGLNRNLGKTPFEIIPLMRSKSRIRWKSLDEGGGRLCFSTDGIKGQGDPGIECAICPKKEWIHKDSKTGQLKPDCDLYQNVICLLRGQEEIIPVAFSGARTRLKPIKDMNSLLLLELQKGRPLFAKCYQVKGVKKANKAGINYFSFIVAPGNGNQVLPEDEMKQANDFFQGMKGKKIVIEEEHMDDPGAPPEHDGPAL